MSKDITGSNRELFIRISIVISANRKLKGLSQEQFADIVGVSRSLISAIEAPRLAYNFTLDVFFNIANALEIPPDVLLRLLPDAYNVSFEPTDDGCVRLRVIAPYFEMVLPEELPMDEQMTALLEELFGDDF